MGLKFFKIILFWHGATALGWWSTVLWHCNGKCKLFVFSPASLPMIWSNAGTCHTVTKRQDLRKESRPTWSLSAVLLGCTACGKCYSLLIYLLKKSYTTYIHVTWNILKSIESNYHCAYYTAESTESTESKKQSAIILSITSPNVDRFSKFVHWQIHWWICNKVVINYPTIP